MTTPEARAVAELAARASYGRLLAIVAAPTRDIALAEDALSEAFERALTTWPRDGVPTNPEGWLLTVARNRLRDVWKSAGHRHDVPLEAAEGSPAAPSPVDDLDPDAVPDRRLELMLVCAHPAIDPQVRTPLMLQTVLGFEAAEIARAYAVPATAMAQRLVRTKRRIRQAGIPFVVPDRSALAARLPTLLEAVYGCYALAWPVAGDRQSLAGEAHHLAVTLATLLPDEPEAWGLAALVTLSMARAGGRDAAYVPLDEQDPAEWDLDLIVEGEGHLRRAGSVATPGGPGRFQLEAAIQAVHCARVRSGVVDWVALRDLHAALLVVAPTLGARVAHAVVVGRIDGPAAGLVLLDALAAEASSVTDFQPFHAARADLLARAGLVDEAGVAYERAVELCDDLRARAHIVGRRAALGG